MSNDLRKAQLIMLDMLKDIDVLCEKYKIEYSLYGGTLLGAVRHKGFIPWDDDLDIAMLRDDYNKFREIVRDNLGKKYNIEINNIRDSSYTVPWIKILNKENFIIDNRDIDYDRGIFIDIFPIDYYSKNRAIKSIEVLLKDKDKIGIRRNSIVNSLIYRSKYFIIDRRPELYKRLVNKLVDCTNKKSNIIGIGKEITMFTCYYNYDDFYPFKKIEFEGCEFWGPNNYKKILENDFGATYMILPPENERKVHSIGFKLS